jgi:hypothetical protein
MTIEQWTEATRELSSLLYQTGLEMGRVNMSSEVIARDKMAQHMRLAIKLNGSIAKITESSYI